MYMQMSLSAFIVRSLIIYHGHLKKINFSVWKWPEWQGLEIKSFKDKASRPRASSSIPQDWTSQGKMGRMGGGKGEERIYVDGTYLNCCWFFLESHSIYSLKNKM